MSTINTAGSLGARSTLHRQIAGYSISGTSDQIFTGRGPMKQAITWLGDVCSRRPPRGAPDPLPAWPPGGGPHFTHVGRVRGLPALTAPPRPPTGASRLPRDSHCLLRGPRRTAHGCHRGQRDFRASLQKGADDLIWPRLRGQGGVADCVWTKPPPVMREQSVGKIAAVLIRHQEAETAALLMRHRKAMANGLGGPILGILVLFGPDVDKTCKFPLNRESGCH